MDSGNSESFQSSSGGDEEYDSRPESISALLNINNNPQTHIASMSNQQPLPPPQPPNHLQSSSPIFDSLPNFFDPLSSSRSLLNFDMVWPKTLRSDPNCNYLGGLVLPFSSSTQNQNQIQRQLFMSNNQLGQTTNRVGSTTFPGIQIPQENANATQRGNSNSSVSNDQNTPINNNSNITNVVVRNNPKKRSRASRRAPTTVLTTDTTNFRAMVQEFTGIPAPPFTSSSSSSSSFPRTRFDLFGSSSSVSLSQSPYNNLLRPFAQKVVSNSATNNVVSNISTTSVNYHQLSSSSSSSDQLANFLKPPLPHHHSHQQEFNINMQNPILNFQSLLQTQQKYPPSASVVEDQFGLSHGQVNHWGSDGVGSNDNTSGRNDNVDQGLVMRSINEGNYSTHSERQVVSEDNKRPEINVTPRSEGIVESWICSSD